MPSGRMRPEDVKYYCAELDDKPTSEWEKNYLIDMVKIAEAGIPLTLGQTSKMEELVTKYGVPPFHALTSTEDELWN